MNGTSSIVLLWLTIYPCFLGHEARALVRPSRQDALTRPLGPLDSSPRPITSAVQLLLITAGVPGGEVTLEGCGGVAEKYVRLQGTSLREALDSITRADPEYKWEFEDGVVNLLPLRGAPALLRSRVRRFDSGDASDAVSAGTWLLALPDIREAAARLGLVHSVSGSGLRGMPSGPPPPKKPLDVHLEEVTLLGALNAIVRQHHHGIWLYREIHCGPTNLFDVNWSD